MRDTERGRERISIQLEPRQITMFIVVSLVTLGGLFAGGYFLGRQHAQDTVAMGPALSGLAAIDAEGPRKASPDSAEARTTPTALGDVEFMFPSALGSRPGRKVKRRSPVRLAEAHVGVQGAAPVSKSTPKVERPEPKIKIAKAKAKAKAKRQRVVEARPKRPAKTAPAPKRRVTASLPPSSMARLDNAARPAVAVPALPVAPVPARLAADEDAPARRPAPSNRNSRRYTVQLKSAHVQDRAETFAAMIRRKGYAPRVVLAQVPGKGTLYRVRVGEFGSRAEARKFQRMFRSKTGHADAGFITEL